MNDIILGYVAKLGAEGGQVFVVILAVIEDSSRLRWPQAIEEAEMTLARSAYADVNGIKLYHEIYGAGEPLVLIHGGLTTISEMGV